MHRKNLVLRKATLIGFSCLSLSVLLGSYSATLAQNRLAKNQQAIILKEVCEKLQKYYAFPEMGERLGKMILDKFEKGGYPYNVTPEKFLEALNDDLLNTSRDKHLKLLYDPEEAKTLKVESEENLADSEIASERWLNFGFRKLEILDGNIGYMNLSDFCSVKYGGEKAVTAMNFFSSCNSLIIDLRQNGGGSDDMVVFLASYFIDSTEPIVFNISYSTIDTAYYASMMYSYVPGRKLIDIPIYILTTGATASAAEAFTNILKNNNPNVILVGQKTRGAENPVNHLLVHNEYVLRIPSWRRIYSSLNTTWEGAGLSPDIKVDEEKALTTAHLHVLERLMRSASDRDELSHYQWAYDGVKALNDSILIPVDVLRSYEGNYNGRGIYYENGNLYYGHDKKKLIPVAEDYFLVKSVDYFRIKFIRENSKVVALERIFVYGYSSRHSKE